MSPWIAFGTRPMSSCWPYAVAMSKFAPESDGCCPMGLDDATPARPLPLLSLCAFGNKVLSVLFITAP